MRCAVRYFAMPPQRIANALRRDRIRVNGINLGWTDTPNEHVVQKKQGSPDNWLEIAERRVSTCWGGPLLGEIVRHARRFESLHTPFGHLRQ